MNFMLFVANACVLSVIHKYYSFINVDKTPFEIDENLFWALVSVE